jgi:alpha-L-fucosidase
MDIYYQSVGRGGVMLLNATPNTDGLIPEGDMQRYRELGAEIDRRFGHPIAETSGRGDMLEMDMGKPTLVNHVMIMEDYWFGERIRSYVVEGLAEGQWKKLAEGVSVGRKRIESFENTEVTKVRLHVTKSVANPLIRRFAAFHVAQSPAAGQTNPKRVTACVQSVR